VPTLIRGVNDDQIGDIRIMHFQDLYNIDLNRVQRCGIHYATPDGRMIPFCSYNTLHREDVERRFSVPLDEWERSHAGR